MIMKIVDVECYLNARSEIDAVIDMQKSAGVEVTLLMPPPNIFPDNASIQETTTGRTNIVKIAAINPRLGQDALDEMDKVHEWDFRGIKLTPPKHGYQISEKFVHPFLEKAIKLGMIVTIHSGQEQCNPGDIGFVAMEFPRLPIIMDHMGYRYQVREAIQASKFNPNLYLATTAVPEPRFFTEAVEVLGPTKLMFGSNCPLIPPDIEVELIRRAHLKKADEELVLGGNALRVLGIEG
jgi:predicted TIM-barrel fold metal-dependent hydrolase